MDLVTGASGFVGSHLVDRLLSDGRDVRLLLRPTSSPRWIREDLVEVVRIKEWNQENLAPVFEGVDRLFHLAGVTHARDKTAFFDFHVNVTKHLLNASLAASPPPTRVVVFSSLAAAGPSRTGRPLVEDDPPCPVSWYGESKLEQERIVCSYRDRLSVVVLRPPAIYGPRDEDFLPLFRTAKRGFCPAPAGGAGMQSLTFVGDIVSGACLAGTGDVPSGRVYFVTSHEIATWKAVGAVLERTLGKNVRTVPIPLWIIPLIGMLGEMSNRLLKTHLPVDRNKAMEGRFAHWTCSPARMERELGFRASVELSDGIDQTLRWYQKSGWL